MRFAQLQPELLSLPESAGKTHRAGRRAPLPPTILPTASPTIILTTIRSTLLLTG